MYEYAEKKKADNTTGIPVQTKEKFEAFSGFSFDDVQVHYNSDKPARVNALAYTQGNQVYLGSGQECHLNHELGHVIQQKRGQIAPTGKVNGLNVNWAPELEREADHLGNAADQVPCVQRKEGLDGTGHSLDVIQRETGDETEDETLFSEEEIAELEGYMVQLEEYTARLIELICSDDDDRDVIQCFNWRDGPSIMSIVTEILGVVRVVGEAYFRKDKVLDSIIPTILASAVAIPGITSNFLDLFRAGDEEWKAYIIEFSSLVLSSVPMVAAFCSAKKSAQIDQRFRQRYENARDDIEKLRVTTEWLRHLKKIP